MTELQKKNRHIERLKKKVEELENENRILNYDNIRFADNIDKQRAEITFLNTQIDLLKKGQNEKLSEKDAEIKVLAEQYKIDSENVQKLHDQIESLKADHAQTLQTLKTMVENIEAGESSFVIEHEKHFILKIISSKLTEPEAKENVDPKNL